MSRATAWRDQFTSGPLDHTFSDPEAMTRLFLHKDASFSIQSLDSDTWSLQHGTCEGSSLSSQVNDHMSNSQIETSPSPSTQAWSRTLTMASHTNDALQWASHEIKATTDVQGLLAIPQPRLRMLSLQQQHSYAPIDITHAAFEELIKHGQVFRAIYDTILRLGQRTVEMEVAPPRPRVHLLHDCSFQAQISGVEISYGLRYVQQNFRSGWKKWSLRQFAVYNRQSDKDSTANWLFVAMPDEIRATIDAYLGQFHEDAAGNPFAIHVTLICAVIATWRPYLGDLVTESEELRKTLMLATHEGDGPCKQNEDDNLQGLKMLEDDVLDVLLSLRATDDTIDCLLDLTEQVRCDKALPGGSGVHNNQDFVRTMLQEKRKDVQLLIHQATILKTKLEGTSTIVTTFLSLANEHSLGRIALESKLESRQIGRLAVITLIYLPITVVLNFFSASFVNDEGIHMELHDKWWLFLVISVPLTVLTLLGWKIWSCRQDLRLANDKRPSRRFRLPFRGRVSRAPIQDVEMGGMGSAK